MPCIRPLKVGGFNLKAFIETSVSLSIVKVLLVGEKMQSQKELKLAIDNAQKLHGHLGPFLVLGVRMGIIAKKALSVSDDQCG
ncbi:MAG TPA: FmdE family protein, partial [Candidatus Bathyarchaeia archaeon]|nr:FmdE family protein [Candidatus Bathyarchaeia archaeon]